VMRHILLSIDYARKDMAAVGKPDKKVIGAGPKFLKR